MRKLLMQPSGWIPPAAWQWVGLAGLLGLLGHSMAWNLLLSPGGPYPGWMAASALPLLTPLRGLLHGRRGAAQWASLLPLPYLLGSMVAIHGYWVPPYFTGTVDFWGALGQGLWGALMLTGSVYFAAATAARESS